MRPMNKPKQMPPKPAGVVAPPPQPKKPAQPPLSGFIAVISIENGGVNVHPKMPQKPASNFYALSFDKQYRIDLDEEEIREMNSKKVKPFNTREPQKKGWFSKPKPVQTSVNKLFVNEQYHKDLAEIEFVSFHQSLQQARALPKNSEANEVYIEARTSNNKRALMKGAGKFGLALNMIKKQAAKIGNALKGPAKEMAKDEIKNKLHGGFPDLIGDAKKLVKYSLYLPANGYKAIQNKAKAIYKEIKGGDPKKAKKCCDDIQKQCAKKCNKQKGGGCGCKGKCHCKKPGQCGGGKEFNIYSKANQDFGKELKKQYNKKANPLKAQIQKIQKFKKQLQKLPAKDFDNKLKSKKHMSNSQKKKEMIDRQDKKIADKKRAIKDHEQKIYGPFRPKGGCGCKNKKQKGGNGGPRLLQQLKALDPTTSKNDYFSRGRWNIEEMLDDLRVLQNRSIQNKKGKKLFDQLRAIDPTASSNDYFKYGQWNIEDILDDTRIIQNRLK